MRLHNRTTSIRTRRGNTVLEAALVLPILLGLAFGTVEFGHYLYVKHNLQGAAREGVRAAILSSATNADVTNAITNVMNSAGIAAGTYTITLSPSNVANAASGTQVTVTVSCTWGNVGVRPLGIISASKQVAGLAVMRRE